MKKRVAISPVSLILLMLGLVFALSNVFIMQENGVNYGLLVMGNILIAAGIIIMRHTAIKKRIEEKDKENVKK